MTPPRLVAVAVVGLLTLMLTGCSQTETSEGCGSPRVVATATFLADITQNVAGERCAVESLVPLGADLHAYQATPQDLAKVVAADIVVMNGAGLEGTLASAVRNAGGHAAVIEASSGLSPRRPQPDEPLAGHEDEEAHEDEAHENGDPHFWLDPLLAIRYVENVRDALVEADPNGAADYEANAAAYIKELRVLDRWIEDQVATLPPEQRLLVMNHVSHGYFADRYGFRIVGAVLPSAGTGAAPTARQLSSLTQTIRATGVKAIFVEAHEDPSLARQIARETGVQVIDDLLDHALTEAGGVAPTYIEMMKFDTRRIVEALR